MPGLPLVRSAGAPVPGDPALQALQAAGRPDPGADLAWMRERLGPEVDLQNLVPFYVLGRKHLKGSDSEARLGRSLQGIERALQSERGVFEGVSREDRVFILKTLIEVNGVHPGSTLDHAAFGGEVDVLEVLRNAIRRFMDGHALLQLGDNTLKVPLWETSRPPSLAQAVHSYAACLERIRKAPGRIEQRTTGEDRQWAVDATEIEINHFQGEPGRLGLFQRLMSTFQDPAIAFRLFECFESLDEPARATGLRYVQTELAALGSFPDDWEKTRAEGRKVETLAPRLALALPNLRPGNTVESMLQEIEGTAKWILDELPRSAPWRGPGQSLAQGAENYEGMSAALAGWDAQDARELAELLLRRSASKEEHAAGLAELKQALQDAGRDSSLRSLARHALSETSEPLLAGYRRRSTEFELTGELTGLDTVRKQIAEGLAEGRYKGTEAELLGKFERIVLHRRLRTDDKKAATRAALKELEEVAQGSTSTVKVTEGAVWVGGVRLKSRDTGEAGG